MNAKIPTCEFIDRSPDSEKLYSLEHKRGDLIKRCAEELMRVLDIDKADMPMELFNVLESYERDAGIAAAVGFLRYHGFEVSGIGHCGIPSRFHNPLAIRYHIEGEEIVTEIIDEQDLA